MTAAEIAFEHVSKTFGRDDGNYAVRDLSFSVDRGELVAILGKTGCGNRPPSISSPA